MSRIQPSAAVTDLIAPLRSLLDGALARLPGGPSVSIELGDVPGFYALHGQTLMLSEGLLGPDMHHPVEPDGLLRLDRWRRAACSVAEGVVLAAMSQALGRSADLSDWRWVGAAIELADHACPDLQWALSDLVRCAERGSPGQEPRQGAAVFRAIRRRGEDPQAQAMRWIRGEDVLDGPGWMGLGAWVLGAGLAAEVPLPVEPPARVDIPVSAPAWSFLRLEVPAHRRGGLVRCEGGAVVQQAWAEGGRPLRTLAGALSEPGRLLPEVGGPVGRWESVSAHGFGQVFGVRGITWTLHGDGRLELLLADAFAGPPEALQMAEQMGTSGVAPGRWIIAGDRSIAFRQLVTTGLTMHGRSETPYALPAAGGLGQVLQGIQEGTWAWRITDGELFLDGRMMGGPIQMRFKPT